MGETRRVCEIWTRARKTAKFCTTCSFTVNSYLFWRTGCSRTYANSEFSFPSGNASKHIDAPTYISNWNDWGTCFFLSLLAHHWHIVQDNDSSYSFFTLQCRKLVVLHCFAANFAGKGAGWDGSGNCSSMWLKRCYVFGFSLSARTIQNQI